VEQPDSRPNPPGIIAASLVALLVDLVLLAWLTYLTTHARDAFRALFEDFDAKLPQLTCWLLYPRDAVFLGILVAAALILAFKEVMLRNAAVNLAINLVAGLAILAAREVFLAAMWLPLIGLMEHLSG
jgi:hypothetical protein